MSGFESNRPLDPWRWLGVPLLACIAATIIFAVPLRLFGFRLPEPVFAMIPAFAWAVIRPSFLPPFLLLLLGLFLDIFHHAPLGLWAISLLAAYGAVFATRLMMSGQARGMMWAWYAASCAVAFGVAFLFTTLDSLAVPDLISVAWQYLVTALMYPLAHRLIERFEDADVRFR